MAAYAVDYYVISGTPDSAVSDLHDYLETLDSTNEAIVNISCVGNNEQTHYLIITNTAP